MRSFKELTVWQESMLFVKQIYVVTRSFPKEELFVLTNQMRRSAISIPSNIAEGHMRRGTKEFLQFTQIAFELDYFDKSQHDKLMKQLDYISRMLNKLIWALRKKSTH